MTPPRSRTSSAAQGLATTGHLAALLALIGCAPEPMPPISVPICIDLGPFRGPEAVTADGPVYAAWFWRAPDGLEAAGQVRIDDTPELELACAQLQPPGPQAVAHFKLEDSVSFWTPDPGPYRDAHDRPLAWRGWAPLLLVYADTDRDGRFTDAVDVALAANQGAGYDGVSWGGRNVFYLPHAASTWRARAHLPHLRLFQSHPGSLFVHGQGRRIEWPTRFGVQVGVPARGFRRHPDAPDAGDPGDAGAGGGP